MPYLYRLSQGRGRCPPKVFCAGFHKTGTSSLTVALRRLGYRVTGPNGVHDPDIAVNAAGMVERLSHQFDAFQDNPWPLFYREMDRLHPGSLFILTMREADAWWDSVLKHFGQAATPMREWIYGEGRPSASSTAIYLERYRRHNADVMAYFADRPNDLLILRLEEGLAWGPLCRFLDHPVPEEPFPYANRADARSHWKDLKRSMRTLLTGREEES